MDYSSDLLTSLKIRILRYAKSTRLASALAKKLGIHVGSSQPSFSRLGKIHGITLKRSKNLIPIDIMFNDFCEIYALDYLGVVVRPDASMKELESYADTPMDELSMDDLIRFYYGLDAYFRRCDESHMAERAAKILSDSSVDIDLLPETGYRLDREDCIEGMREGGDANYMVRCALSYLERPTLDAELSVRVWFRMTVMVQDEFLHMISKLVEKVNKVNTSGDC